jgi:hypothetical protein
MVCPRLLVCVLALSWLVACGGSGGSGGTPVPGPTVFDQNPSHDPQTPGPSNGPNDQRPPPDDQTPPHDDQAPSGGSPTTGTGNGFSCGTACTQVIASGCAGAGIGNQITCTNSCNIASGPCGAQIRGYFQCVTEHPCTGADAAPAQAACRDAADALNSCIAAAFGDAG